MKPYVFYGWHLSLYSGKTRAYLRYKAIPHVEKPPRAWTMRTIRRRTGATVMPAVVTPEGEWLQDTSHIIDTLERRFPQAPIVPATRRQRVAAYLLEAWGDEFWLPSAMHYRWNFDENYRDLFRIEGGDNLAPFMPRFIKDRFAAKAAAGLRAFLPGLGVVPAQLPAIEAWTVAMCDALDAHFAKHPYLLGTRPSIGDFGLIGPLYAHLGRDPYPARTLIAPRRHLAAWVQRMLHPPQPLSGEFLPRDALPETLAPLFASVFGEFWTQLRATLPEIEKATASLPPGKGFKRALGEIELPMAGRPYRQLARPYSLWMAQRALDAYAALDRDARAEIDDWAAGVGGAGALQLEVPRLQRIALRVRPE